MATRATPHLDASIFHVVSSWYGVSSSTSAQDIRPSSLQVACSPVVTWVPRPRSPKCDGEDPINLIVFCAVFFRAAKFVTLSAFPLSLRGIVVTFYAPLC
jgi:hypothetical protein